MRQGVPRGLLAVVGILGLGIGLGLLAVAGKPGVLRRPDPVGRPVLLVTDFQNRTAQAELTDLAARLTGAVRSALDGAPDGIFEVSPRWLRPAFGPREREAGLVGIADRLGADYVLAGSLEAGPGAPLGRGSAWSAAAPPDARQGVRPEIRLDVLLVRGSEPPHVFAERFPLGRSAPDGAEAERLARWVADRIALSLTRP